MGMEDHRIGIKFTTFDDSNNLMLVQNQFIAV